MIRLKMGKPLLCIFLFMGCGLYRPALAQTAPTPLRVEEDKMRFHLLPHTVLELPLVNSTNKPISGKFTINLLNLDDDSTVAVTSGAFVEQPGETVEKIAWPAEQLPSDTPSQLGWYRLQYSFEPDSGLPPAQGIVQLGSIITDGFAITLAAVARVAPGSRYPVRLHVENPSTHRPYAYIAVNLVLELNDDENTDVKRKVKTDAEGNASTVFVLPANPPGQEGEVTATVARGPFTEETNLKFQFPEKPAPALTVTTDKPLYQPGQTVHMRLHAINSDGHAMGGAKLDVEIDDENGSEQFHEKLTASRFGIASADWEIPKKIQLGNCTITAKFESDEERCCTERRSEIRISRYELPTFTISVDPDRSYYLLGSNAVVDVHADYLFGKPVQHGKVKIVRQENRQWNSTTQKWEADESAPVEGELGSDGHFKGTVNLGEDFKDFKESNYQRFQDLTLAAYLTDSSTGRTEQRRFKVRISIQPIHIYLIQGAAYRNQPFSVYVTASYADGTPAAVTGKIFAAQPTNDVSFENGFDLSRRRQIGVFHTNRLGIGRADLAPLHKDELRFADWYPEYRGIETYGGAAEEPKPNTGRLVVESVDSKGLRGQHDEEVTLAPTDVFFRVETDHTLYHPGDSIQVKLNSNGNAKQAVLNVWDDRGLLSSQLVSLVQGRASTTIAYDPRFRGEIYLTASTMLPGMEPDKALVGSTSVLYPARTELAVKVRMPQTTFAPGAQVSADVNVLAPNGRATESALGLLVFDRAVAERVRTDEDFGRDYGYSIFDYFNWDYLRTVAGVSYRQLANLDAAKPFPEGMDLIAEAMLHTGSGGWMSEDELAESGWGAGGASEVFAKWIQNKIEPARKALNDWSKLNGEYPGDEAGVRAALAAQKIDFAELRDPWGNPFRAEFSFKGATETLNFVSNGPDKKPRTHDDFVISDFQWPYFQKIGMQIDRASARYFSTTGKYIRDYATLKAELRKQGTDLDALRDPWGHAYNFTFDISGPYFEIFVATDGPRARKRAGAQLWTSSIHYFIVETAALNSAIAETFRNTGTFPQNEEQLKPVLTLAKLDPSQLLDPWGHPYRFRFSTQSRYGDRIAVRDERVYSDPSTQSKKVTESVPVTQQVAYFSVISNGQDNDPNQAFSVADFSRIVAEQGPKDKEPVPTAKQKPLEAGTGGISGVITDASGAVISNAEVKAISVDTGQIFTALADPNGSYAFINLPNGFYQVECDARGFKHSIVKLVPVQSGSSTQVDMKLSVGALAEAVEVVAGLPRLETTTLSAQSVPRQTGTSAEEKPLFTPRLRKYFPETLVWRPEVITDKRGHAHISFTMADNVTAWKMSVLASTEAGQVGIAEKELRSFQPFFLENDPPKLLTEGDQISLPVVLRNYTGAQQVVSTEMEPAPWLTILSPAKERVTVPPNGDATSVFTFRADRSAREAKERITARNAASGDAVERELAVHPNGQEISFSSSRILAGPQNSLEVHLPENAIPGSIDAELRIYPNLLAHVLDVMHGIGRLPTGCDEQITSTSFVSLMALQLLEKGAQDKDKPGAANSRSTLATEARTALQDGYDQLVSLQNSDGGFPYWSTKGSDVALTAYVLRFLNLAGAFIDVNGTMRMRARDYLATRQAKSGAWTSYRWDLKKDVDDPNLTAYVARALAATKQDPATKDPEKQKQAQAALKSALDFLEVSIDSWSDPYLAGNYAIAAVESGRPEHIANAEAVLKRLAHREGDAMYWNLEANISPFYGWGFEGRLETTGLAVTALAGLQKTHPEQDVSDMVSRGLQYLLTHKDHYAMWYSTQATQNVLEAMIAAMPAAPENGAASEATIKINGRMLRSITLPNPQDATGPLTISLPDDLAQGTNKVEVIRAGAAGSMNATLVTSYYIPWTDSEATNSEAFKTGETRALKLKVHYDRTDPGLGDQVRCTVEAERIGFRGYGMMLAEVGLPPGAEVDRASLDKAEAPMYEIQPDKVVFYLWPPAGGSSFAFDFRPRYRIEAMTAPSTVYDYYNPEANATIAPVRFTVH